MADDGNAPGSTASVVTALTNLVMQGYALLPQWTKIAIAVLIILGGLDAYLGNHSLYRINGAITDRIVSAITPTPVVLTSVKTDIEIEKIKAVLNALDARLAALERTAPKDQSRLTK